MRLIDADALLQDGIRVNCGYDADGLLMIPLRDVTKSIKDAPTVNAVVLPCKIGETVFCILRSKNEVVADVVVDYDIWSIKDGVKLRISLLNHKDYVVAEFGKTVFKTRAEAEAALAEREKQ